VNPIETQRIFIDLLYHCALEFWNMILETLTKKSNINKTSQDVILSSETRNDYPVWANQTIKFIAICPDISNFGSVFLAKIHILDAEIKGIDDDVDDLLFGTEKRGLVAQWSSAPPYGPYLRPHAHNKEKK
jgi:hypothetical protein